MVNSSKVLTGVGIAAIVIALIALVVGLSQTQTTTAAEVSKGNNAYIFAEDVFPQATFKFRETTVTYEFQGFTQVNNLLGSVGNFQTRGVSPEFTLQRIVGETPYLHRAVDQTFENNGKFAGMEYDYKQFDVTVDLVQAGQTMRTFEYGDCSISNYKVVTEFDKEEPYTTGGKTGFALLETYTFSCNGFKPIAPTYDHIVTNTYKNGNAKPST